ATPPEVGGVEEGGTEGIEHCHERVGAAATVGRLVGPRRGRKASVGVARYVSVASGVHGDAVDRKSVAEGEVGGVEGGSEGIELRHEGVGGAAAEGRLEGLRRRW